MKPWKKCFRFRDKALCHVLLQPSLHQKEGRKALVAAVYGLGSAASAAAQLTGIIHAWHLNAPIQNLSFPNNTLTASIRLLLAYCMMSLLLDNFKKLSEKCGLTHFFGLSTTVCRRRREEGDAMRGVKRIFFPLASTQSSPCATGCLILI